LVFYIYLQKICNKNNIVITFKYNGQDTKIILILKEHELNILVIVVYCPLNCKNKLNINYGYIVLYLWCIMIIALSVFRIFKEL